MTQEEIQQKAYEVYPLDLDRHLIIEGEPYDNNKEKREAYIRGLTDSMPSLPSNLDEAANDGWVVYEYRESPRGLYSTCYVDGFKAGAEWMMKQLLASNPRETDLYKLGKAEALEELKKNLADNDIYRVPEWLREVLVMAKENGKKEALKDLPKWRKIGRGHNYSLDTEFIINGRYLCTANKRLCSHGR